MEGGAGHRTNEKIFSQADDSSSEYRIVYSESRASWWETGFAKILFCEGSPHAEVSGSDDTDEDADDEVDDAALIRYG